jgi:hypothetical protein
MAREPRWDGAEGTAPGPEQRKSPHRLNELDAERRDATPLAHGRCARFRSLDDLDLIRVEHDRETISRNGYRERFRSVT